MCIDCGCSAEGAKIVEHSHNHSHSHSSTTHSHHHEHKLSPVHAHAHGLSPTRMVKIEQDILGKNNDKK